MLWESNSHDLVLSLSLCVCFREEGVMTDAKIAQGTSIHKEMGP